MEKRTMGWRLLLTGGILGIVPALEPVGMAIGVVSALLTLIGLSLLSKGEKNFAKARWAYWGLLALRIYFVWESISRAVQRQQGQHIIQGPILSGMAGLLYLGFLLAGYYLVMNALDQLCLKLGNGELEKAIYRRIPKVCLCGGLSLPMVVLFVEIPLPGGAAGVAVMAAGMAAGLILGGIGNILFLRSMIQVRREQQRKERGQ